MLKIDFVVRMRYLGQGARPSDGEAQRALDEWVATKIVPEGWTVTVVGWTVATLHGSLN